MNIDKNTKEIGLVLACWGTSYGMNLQAFATQYIIEYMGYNSEILQFRSAHIWNNIMTDIGLLAYIPQVILNKYKKSRQNNEATIDEVHSKNEYLRIESAKAFRNKYLKNFTAQMNYKELQKYCLKYTSVLIGSDQGWLPGFSFGITSSLRFVPKGINRLSYATSLGVSSYPKYCYSSSRKVWNTFTRISVREQEGKDIIDTICQNEVDVKVVVDPTYLISKKEWDLLIAKKRLIQEKYVLCFLLGNDIKQQLFAKDFAEKKGLKLISILSNESTTEIDTTFADQTIIGAGPEDFVNYIRGAEYVITDSFHGIAFSIINERQLFVFYRKRADAKGKMSRNSRIDNIMRLWGIENRIISDYSVDNAIKTPEINYHHINEILEKKRLDSMNYLSEALSL